MNIFVAILLLLELCFFIPIANLKGKENRYSAYTCGHVFKIQKQKKRRIIWICEYYLPTILYEVDGKQYEFQYSKTRNSDEYQVGDDFWVMYNPTNPLDIFQNDGFSLLKAQFLSIIGVWLIIITICGIAL